jgi:hypothetical protein
MTHFMRYTAICLWLTLLIGGIGSLGVFPVLRPLVSIDLMPVVAAGGLAAAFICVAWTVNRIGMRRVARLMRSANVAEREGLSSEAEAALREALAALDCFWVSPASRRNVLLPLAGRLARFYLSQAHLEGVAEDFIAEYLHARPEDEELAELWMRQIASQGGLREEHQDLAARLGNAHPRNPDIQKALARLYLMLERTDYPAMRTYRRVCDAQGRPPAELSADLAQLLREDKRSEAWARQIDFQAQGSGPGIELTEPPRPRDEQWRKAEPETGESSPPADESVESQAAFRMTDGAQALDDEGPEERVSLLARQRTVWPHLRCLAGWAFQALCTQVRRLGGLLGQAIRFAYRLRAVRYGIGVLGVAALTAGGIWMGFETYEVFDAPPSAPAGAESPAPAPAVVADPFTLQVAAYLKQEYALKLVEELKRKGLDAYWTETSSGGKLWYQVRLSHFPDQPSAREYGRNLKGKGVIDDFYVTHYVR